MENALRLQVDLGAADEMTMLATFPQAKAFVYLALAAVLAVVAVALLGISASRSTHAGGTKAAATVSGDASPGSTAHARHQYRISLGR